MKQVESLLEELIGNVMTIAMVVSSDYQTLVYQIVMITAQILK